jgi:hypothetical protein
VVVPQSAPGSAPSAQTRQRILKEMQCIKLMNVRRICDKVVNQQGFHVLG